MCGICGVFFHAREGAVDPAVLQRMGDRLAHRGPDDEGSHLSPDRKLGLGFRRLSIVDLSPGGHQPMPNEDGSVWIVFNGEIYNHADLRPGLEARGHVYRGRSDTETVVHLYQEYGDDCVHHLRGMFAFAIWDERRARLLLARDRLGVKPLYWTDLSGLFLFASEIKALLTHPGVARDVDEGALLHYLTFMVPPAPTTLFRGIRKLRPGHRMVVDRSGIREERYWDPLQPKDPIPAGDRVEQVRALLEESVRLRMMSDVPVGAFLSGGIDSSAIVALMARHGPVNAFTVGYKDSERSNELVHARRVARDVGATHHEVMIGAQDMVDYMPRLVDTQDEPIADPVCVPLFYVSKLAHDAGMKVILVGEGSDELFCGYPGYVPYLQEDRLWQRWGSLLFGPYAGVARALRLLGKGGSLADILDRRRRGQPTFWGGAVVWSGDLKRSLLDDGHWHGPVDDIGFLEQDRPLDVLGRMTDLELRHRLPELLLMRVDKITMSVSLEARVPFLDHRLVELVLPLPMAEKLDGGLKGLLKKAVAGLLPPEIIDRRKQGFPAPVREWFAGMPAASLRHVLLEGPMARRGWFDREFVAAMISGRAPGRRDWSTNLWVLYNLSLWYAHWMEGETVA